MERDRCFISGLIFLNSVLWTFMLIFFWGGTSKICFHQQLQKDNFWLTSGLAYVTFYTGCGDSRKRSPGPVKIGMYYFVTRPFTTGGNFRDGNQDRIKKTKPKTMGVMMTISCVCWNLLRFIVIILWFCSLYTVLPSGGYITSASRVNIPVFPIIFLKHRKSNIYIPPPNDEILR